MLDQKPGQEKCHRLIKKSTGMPKKCPLVLKTIPIVEEQGALVFRLFRKKSAYRQIACR